MEAFESEGCHGCYFVHAIEDIAIRCDICDANDEMVNFSNFRALLGQTIDIERAAAGLERINRVALGVTS